MIIVRTWTHTITVTMSASCKRPKPLCYLWRSRHRGCLFIYFKGFITRRVDIISICSFFFLLLLCLSFTSSEMNSTMRSSTGLFHPFLFLSFVPLFSKDHVCIWIWYMNVMLSSRIDAIANVNALFSKENNCDDTRIKVSMKLMMIVLTMI